MSGLFEAGIRKVVDLDDLEHEFYKHMPAIVDGIFNRLLQLGCYHHRPDKVRNAYIGGGIATTTILLLVLAFLGQSFQAFYFPLGAIILAAVLTAVPIMGFGMVMPARTIKVPASWSTSSVSRSFSTGSRRTISGVWSIRPRCSSGTFRTQWHSRWRRSGPELLRTCTRNPPTGTPVLMGEVSDRRYSLRTWEGCPTGWVAR